MHLRVHSPCNGVVGVCSIARIRVRSLSFFLNGFVRERLAAGVLAEPHGLWYTIGEPDHIMLPGRKVSQLRALYVEFRFELKLNLPVPYMISKLPSQHFISFIIPRTWSRFQHLFVRHHSTWERVHTHRSKSRIHQHCRLRGLLQ